MRASNRVRVVIVYVLTLSMALGHLPLQVFSQTGSSQTRKSAGLVYVVNRSGRDVQFLIRHIYDESGTKLELGSHCKLKNGQEGFLGNNGSPITATRVYYTVETSEGNTHSQGGIYDRKSNKLVVTINPSDLAKPKAASPALQIAGAIEPLCLYVSNETNQLVGITIRSYIRTDGSRGQVSGTWTLKPGEAGYLRSNGKPIIAKRVDYTLLTATGTANLASVVTKAGDDRFHIPIIQSDLPRRDAQNGFTVRVTNKTSEVIDFELEAYVDTNGQERRLPSGNFYRIQPGQTGTASMMGAAMKKVAIRATAIYGGFRTQNGFEFQTQPVVANGVAQFTIQPNHLPRRRQSAGASAGSSSDALVAAGVIVGIAWLFFTGLKEAMRGDASKNTIHATKEYEPRSYEKPNTKTSPSQIGQRGLTGSATVTVKVLMERKGFGGSFDGVNDFKVKVMDNLSVGSSGHTNEIGQVSISHPKGSATIWAYSGGGVNINSKIWSGTLRGNMTITVKIHQNGKVTVSY